jgi:flagellar protein FliO/FliZ
MTKTFVALSVFVGTSLSVAEVSAQSIDRVEAVHENGKLDITILGKDLERLGSPRMRESEGAIQFEFAEANVGQGLQLVRLNDQVIKSVLLADLTSGRGARVRVTAASVDANRLIHAQKAETTVIDGGIRIQIPTQDLAHQRARRLADEPVVSGGAIEESIARPVLRSRAPAAEPLEPEAEKRESAAPRPANQDKQGLLEKSESDIPVKAETAAASGGAVATDPLQRLTLTMVVVLALLGVVYIGVRRYAGQRMASNMANSDRIKIRIINRQSLGPRQGLAVVQVAGEVMLIGHTDHSISHIKTLSLIDDELPAEPPVPVNSPFAKTLNEQKESEVEGEDFASAGLSEIRDRVTSKLKGMRMLE